MPGQRRAFSFFAHGKSSFSISSSAGRATIHSDFDFGILWNSPTNVVQDECMVDFWSLAWIRASPDLPDVAKKNLSVYRSSYRTVVIINLLWSGEAIRSGLSHARFIVWSASGSSFCRQRYSKIRARIEVSGKAQGHFH